MRTYQSFFPLRIGLCLIILRKKVRISWKSHKEMRNINSQLQEKSQNCEFVSHSEKKKSELRVCLTFWEEKVRIARCKQKKKSQNCQIKSCNDFFFFFSVSETGFHSFLFQYILKCYLFLWFSKAEFSAAITAISVFSVTWSFRNHSDMLILKHLFLNDYFCLGKLLIHSLKFLILCNTEIKCL